MQTKNKAIMKKNNTQTNASKANKVAAKNNKNQKTVKEVPAKLERELKKSLSDEVLAEQLADARARKGEVISFECTKTSNLEIGLIRTARLDKRSGFIQFRIELLTLPEFPETLIEGATGTVTPAKSEKDHTPYQAIRTGIIYGKGNDNQDIKVIGTYSSLPKPVKEEPEKKEKPAKKADKKASKKSENPAEKKAKKPAKKLSEEELAKEAALKDMRLL